METTASATRRGIAIGLVLAMAAAALWTINEDRADATAPAVAAANFMQIGDDVLPPQLLGGWFAKYDGVDGESNDANHEDWIDILKYEWGVARPTAGLTGDTRRRGAPVIDDFVMTFEYEKAAPKLLEKCLRGEVIPKLEVELTTTFEVRETYLRYEMKNVLCTAYGVGGYADGSPPTVVVANNFEEIKVTYTEYDNEGNSAGNVETEWKVEKGA